MRQITTDDRKTMLCDAIVMIIKAIATTERNNLKDNFHSLNLDYFFLALYQTCFNGKT